MEFLVGDFFTRLSDAPAKLRRLRHVLTYPSHLDAFLKRLRVPDPMERLDLPSRQPHQRIPVSKGMVHERQRMVSRQRAQPQRDLGEVHRHRIPIDSVQTLPGDEAAGMDHLVLVGRNDRHRAVGAPRIDQRVGKLAAGLDQEGAGAHGRVADLDVENLRRGRRPTVLAAEPFEDGRQGMAHDGLGQLAGGVVGARSAALLVRLQHEGAGRYEVRGRVLVQHAVERRVQVFHRLGGAESLRDGVPSGSGRFAVAAISLGCPSPAPAARQDRRCSERRASSRAGLMATDRPVATSIRKPMMVSYTEPICSTSRVR